MPKFKTTIEREAEVNAMGIVVPEAIIEKLAAGKKPKVTVSLKGYTYRSTVFFMGGEYKIPLAKEHRAKAGISDGEKLEIALELDTAPREVDVPKDLAAALKKAGLTKDFAALAYTHRKEHVRAIEEAKAAETRARRIEKAVAMVEAKRK